MHNTTQHHTIGATQVALLIDTALASGRGILGGIAEFTRQYDGWLTYHEPRDIEHAIPSWLTHWQGHGIIARIQSREMLRTLQKTGLPVVDVHDRQFTLWPNFSRNPG